MSLSPWSKGRKIEAVVENLYKDQGYKTWRPPKTKFGAQDIFGIGDIIASNPKELVLIAVALNRFQSETIKKIFGMLPFLPEYITVRYYVFQNNLKKDNEKFIIKEWKGQS